MSSPSLREVIAKAIFEEPTKDGSPRASRQWEDLPCHHREGWMKDADRVVAAIYSYTTEDGNDLLDRLRREWALLRPESNWREMTEEAIAEVSRLRLALRFYAEPDKYTDCHGDDVHVPDFYSELDFGETARVTLKRIGLL